MSILLAAFAAMGVDVTPNAVNWANITGALSGTNSNQTISGINTPITISIADDNFLATMEYSINGGSFTPYGGPFSISDGQTLRWSAATDLGAISGTITVTNDSDASTTLDTFTYNLTG